MKQLNQVMVSELSRKGSTVQVAVFDFDGTISTLRCGWESIMEQVMLRHLASGGLSTQRSVALIRDYIEESTGIQTIYQMEWLVEQVRALGYTAADDPWEYKDEYNVALLEMVNGRIKSLADGTAKPEDFLVRGSKEFLQRLRDNGVEIHIASGTDDVDLQKETELLGIAPLVQSVKGAPHRKKDCSKEAVIRDILTTHPLTGRQMMVVGDGKVEIILGNEAGAMTIGIASQELNMNGELNPKKLEKLRQANADYITADFEALVGQWDY